MLKVPTPVAGNRECRELAETALAIIKEGRVCHLSIILCTEKVDELGVMLGGQFGFEAIANHGADILKRKLVDSSLDRLTRHGDPKAPANRVYYDMERMPVSFDFLPAIINGEMTRRREGVQEPLRVAFRHPGEQFYNTRHFIEQAFDGIVRPIVKLLGGTEDRTSTQGREIYDCKLRTVVEAYGRGEELPIIRPPAEQHEVMKEMLAGCSPVTITLREAAYSVQRNSNVEEWIKFATWLEGRGEHVIFVRDTARAREDIPGFETMPTASEDLLVRVALYQEAKCNLFVANGPHVLALFMDRPWMVVSNVQDDVPYRPNTTKGWRDNAGIEPGDQFPWCGPQQRYVWAEDRFEVIRDAWLEHMG